MFLSEKTKGPRQGCTTQKSGLGMHQPIKKQTNPEIGFWRSAAEAAAYKLAETPYQIGHL